MMRAPQDDAPVREEVEAFQERMQLAGGNMKMLPYAKKRFMTNGCFDGFHAGHLRLIQGIMHNIRKCTSDDNIGVYILIDSDRRYEEIRGYPPQFTYDHRKEVVHTIVKGILAKMNYKSIKVYISSMDIECAAAILAIAPTTYFKGSDLMESHSPEKLRDDRMALAQVEAILALVPIVEDERGKLSSSRRKDLRDGDHQASCPANGSEPHEKPRNTGSVGFSPSGH